MPNASVQQVRYDVPQQSPWAAGLEGLIQGGGGAIKGYYGRQAEQQKNLMSLLPVLLQMRQAKPGGVAGQPGVMNVPGLGPFTATDPTPDYGAYENQQQGAKLQYENENRDLINRQKRAEKAFEAVIVTGPNNSSVKQAAWEIYNSILNGETGQQAALPTAPLSARVPDATRPSMMNMLNPFAQGSPYPFLLNPVTAGKQAIKMFKGKGKEIRVRLKATGQTGTINSNEFDSKLYEKL